MSEAVKLALQSKFLEARGPGQLRQIAIDGAPPIYYWPKPSLRELIATEEGAKSGSNWQTALAMVVARARDEHGRLIFGDRDRDAVLDRYGPDVIVRLAAEMVTDRVDAESAEKN